MNLIGYQEANHVRNVKIKWHKMPYYRKFRNPWWMRVEIYHLVLDSLLERTEVTAFRRERDIVSYILWVFMSRFRIEKEDNFVKSLCLWEARRKDEALLCLSEIAERNWNVRQCEIHKAPGECLKLSGVTPRNIIL